MFALLMVFGAPWSGSTRSRGVESCPDRSPDRNAVVRAAPIAQKLPAEWDPETLLEPYEICNNQRLNFLTCSKASKKQNRGRHLLQQFSRHFLRRASIGGCHELACAVFKTAAREFVCFI